MADPPEPGKTCRAILLPLEPANASNQETWILSNTSNPRRLGAAAPDSFFFTINNYDMALAKTLPITESKAFIFGIEIFNTF